MDNLESQRDGESFLLKLTEIIRNNFDNEQFGVKEAARIFGVSRSHLHRRLKKLTGKSVSQFIRELRLEKAMELLQKDMATVSEVAYSVGFHSPTYFNTCFKEHYGLEVFCQNSKRILLQFPHYCPMIVLSPLRFCPLRIGAETPNWNI